MRPEKISKSPAADELTTPVLLAQGHLFLRLTEQTRATDTATRTLRRRFAAAWAA